MEPNSPLYPISLNTVAVLTGRSLRTWQRRVEEGLVPRLGGARTLVPFAVVLPSLPVPLAEADVQVLVRADQGDAEAQADIGALFAAAALREQRDLNSSGGGGGSIVVATHFLTQAAEQGQADAMHWLSMLHAAGLAGQGQGDSKTLTLMWLAKAAASGHAIAQKQLEALRLGGDV